MADAFDDFLIQFTFGNDLREFFRRHAEFLQELLVGGSGVDIVADVVPQHCPGFVRNPRQPGDTAYGKRSPAGTEFDGLVHGIHVVGSFPNWGWMLKEYTQQGTKANGYFEKGLTGLGPPFGRWITK